MAQAGPPSAIEPEALQQYGKLTVDLLQRHFEGLPTKAIKPQASPGDFAKRFREKAPEQPTEFAELLKKIEEDVLPGVTHWQHPRFMAYYPSTTSLPAVLSETIVAALGSVGLQWSANPIATELEVLVMDWLTEMLGLGPAFLHTSGVGGGIIQNTAGEAMANIMVCARVRKHRSMQPDLPRDEAFYANSSKLVVYFSDQAHFSGPKACRVAGMRPRVIKARKIDGNYRLSAEDVQSAIQEDKANGLVPTVLFLTYGTTNTCSFDRPADFESIAREENLWVHVDAAYAGPAWMLPEFKKDSEAVGRIATSVNVGGAKWFLCGFDSCFLWVRDRRFLTDVHSATDIFMAPGNDDIYSPEFKDWSIPLGRRFRALRIWMVIEYFGTDGIKAFLRRALDQADFLRGKIAEHPAYEVAIDSGLGLVCVRFANENSTERVGDLSRHLQDAGFLCYPSQVEGKPMLRVALGGSATREDDVEGLWKEMNSFATTPEAGQGA
mmetsp:Transcript_17634/g.37750  ORF Transcript_17634/g.37750 Transcript_17634/m.37750 type:complete len:494 (+) Transcript_17634:835-2316(+)